MEEVWDLDAATGNFLNQIPGTAGMILRPDDYSFIELKR